MLTLYPAIDLKDGAIVRLRRGDMDDATTYGTDPAAQARVWQEAGCRWLHVVDLNGAFAGRPVNRNAVESIIAAAGIPVQLGGGLRSLADIESWLEAGVARVILGSAAARDPDLVRQAARAHPGRIAVGIDARDGKVATDGWATSSATLATELARRYEQDGVAVLIYTDIARDGMLGGVNIEATLALADLVSTPVIASGGVGGAEDLRALRRQADGRLEGVIVGRALYDGRVDAATALAILQSEGDKAA